MIGELRNLAALFDSVILLNKYLKIILLRRKKISSNT